MLKTSAFRFMDTAMAHQVKLAQSSPHQRCPYCHDTLSQLRHSACPSCLTPHHHECLDLNEGCSVLGCRNHRESALNRFLRTPAPQPEPAGVGRALSLGLWWLTLLFFGLQFAVFLSWLFDTPTHFRSAEVFLLTGFRF